MTIQSRSPWTSRVSFFGSSLRTAAMLGRSSADDSRVLGLGGSTSRMTRSISSNAAARNSLELMGWLPVSSS